MKKDTNDIRINIIDPTSSEFNRGSFCYAPYLLYNGLNTLDGITVNIIETFVVEDIDKLPPADVNVVCLWSYPQIEACQTIANMLPIKTLYYVGYTPLIEHLGLPHIESYLGFDPLIDSAFLRTAMKEYPNNYSKFRRLLLSDCDMHLKNLDKGDLVHPLFTSYGCPNRCSFCPSTRNCGYKRVVLSVDDTNTLFDECIEKGVKCIHLTDEDFFFSKDRTAKILKHLKGKGLRLIALGSADKVYEFVQEYGTDIIRDAGIELIEIGFESGDTSVSEQMGAGKSLDSCARLARIQDDLPFDIFWLVMTFFPGENIQTLRQTGIFMEQYGKEIHEVLGRLRTNGTKGGLGQFFQPYHGLPIFSTLAERGKTITSRPVRLIPSFIPNSFLNSKISEINYDNIDKARPWLDTYDTAVPKNLRVGTYLKQYVEDRPWLQQVKNAIALAILARMEVIR